MRPLLTVCLSLLLLLSVTPAPALAERVVVLGGVEEVIAWMQAEDWWGDTSRRQQRAVPRFLIARISKNWQVSSAKLPVAVKKEVFYRAILPLVIHANEMVRDQRHRLLSMQRRVARGEKLSDSEQQALKQIASQLRIGEAGTAKVLAAALYKLDEIPAGLVLGQAAYESGYGTSRFAVEGNALFGQWTFGGKGLVPEQQRTHLGDHRIAAYDWPFDSVRAYFVNLNSHPAYEKFRKLRAALRAKGKPLSSLVLADGLTAYSERGQAYVDTLKGMIRVNDLQLADDAYFRDEPMRFVIGVKDEAAAVSMRKQVNAMQETGELSEVINSMRLN